MVHRRPKDRKEQIALAAATAFSALGYHGVRMDAIAAEVGISAAALYRHYPGKYALFRAAVLDLGGRLVDAANRADATPAGLIDALLDVTLANRAAGGLYRWQARYLDADDRALLRGQMRAVHGHIYATLPAGLPPTEQRIRSSALLSVVGSIVDHRAKLPAGEIRRVISAAATAVLGSGAPDEPVVGAPARRMFSTADTGPYEAVLHAAMLLFNEHGYHDTTMEQIASAVGMPTSGIYRYFPAKGDVLATSMRRAADWVSGELSAASSDGTPQEVLDALVAAYVGTSFANPELAFVYYTERGNLAPADRALLRHVQQSTIDSWVRLLTASRPELTAGQARFLVHAAMALVIDIGSLVRYDPSDQARVRGLMRLAMRGS